MDAPDHFADARAQVRVAKAQQMKDWSMKNLTEAMQVPVRMNGAGLSAPSIYGELR